MKKVVRKFSSHADADKAEDEYYASLTPQQCMEILYKLIEQSKAPHELGQKPARVCRIVKLHEG